jgi:hypothetical protein
MSGADFSFSVQILIFNPWVYPKTDMSELPMYNRDISQIYQFGMSLLKETFPNSDSQSVRFGTLFGLIHIKTYRNIKMLDWKVSEVVNRWQCISAPILRCGFSIPGINFVVLMRFFLHPHWNRISSNPTCTFWDPARPYCDSFLRIPLQ